MSTIKSTKALLEEIRVPREKEYILNYYMGIGYKEHLTDPVPVARAWALHTLLTRTKKWIYKNDIIVGSGRGLFEDGIDEEENRYYSDLKFRFGDRNFGNKADHLCPAYDRLLSLGIDGILDEIKESKKSHSSDKSKLDFLRACEISMNAFSEMIKGYRDAAEDEEIKAVLDNISHNAPKTFREALQLVWFSFIVFTYQGLFAMALGRMDQYLYPFYKHDKEAGILTDEDTQAMLENVFAKIHERTVFIAMDDTNNIAIAGITPDGKDATNELTYLIMRAVRACNIPGPNLSARIASSTPDEFLEEALETIGTGLGYPALMNDTVNISALKRMGYREEDCNNYCMVGCIENFLPGLQPPWSDGRFDTVKLLEYTLGRGYDLLTEKRAGSNTGAPGAWHTMEDFMASYTRQLELGAEEYVNNVNLYHAQINDEFYVNPYMSCLCYDCIEKGLDINNGGSRYPSAHGACGMGIGTIADSLAAIEKCIFIDKSITWDELIAAIKTNYVGYEETRQKLLAAPKYGNDDDFVDKYAEWFVNINADIFDKYRLPDGGRFYTAIASNISNIYAGENCAATPDGRLAHEPQSDAASPTYGRDKNGPTSTIKSVSKPDYSRVACGTVVNQKYSPTVFANKDNIKKLAALIRVYFERGGQEIQINSVSREILTDAMNNPDKYSNLVVRVSGFSAYYTSLDKRVQFDILNRTEQS